MIIEESNKERQDNINMKKDMKRRQGPCDPKNPR